MNARRLPRLADLMQDSPPSDVHVPRTPEELEQSFDELNELTAKWNREV